MSSVPFKPLNLAELLDATFKFYRDRFKLLFLTLLLFQTFNYLITKLVIGAYGFPFNPRSISVSGFGPFLVYFGMLLVVLLLTNVFQLGSLTFLISDSLMQQPTSIKTAIVRMFGHFGPLLGTSIWSGFIILLGLVFCVIPGIYFFFSYLFVTQVVLIEGTSGPRALERSKDLMRTKSEKGFTKSNVFKASMLLLVVGVITYSVQTVTALPQIAYAMYKSMQFTNGNQPGNFVNSPVYILTELLGVIGLSLTKPLGMIAIILLYYDIRSRKEGLDLEMMADSIASPKTPPSEPL